jgi:hypothetical protein
MKNYHDWSKRDDNIEEFHVLFRADVMITYLALQSDSLNIILR